MALFRARPASPDLRKATLQPHWASNCAITSLLALKLSCVITVSVRPLGGTAVAASNGGLRGKASGGVCAATAGSASVRVDSAVGLVAWLAAGAALVGNWTTAGVAGGVALGPLQPAMTRARIMILIQTFLLDIVLSSDFAI